MATVMPSKHFGVEAVRQSLLDDLYEAVGHANFNDLKRWALTGKILESKLKHRPIAIMGTVSMTAMRYKVISVAVHDWIRLGGSINRDFATPLEAMQNDRD